MASARPAIAVASAFALALGGCAAMPAARLRPDTLVLGRNAAGEPCTATRNWRDAGLSDLFDQSWELHCRNVAASRTLGTIRVVSTGRDRGPAPGGPDCGDAKTMDVKGIGAVAARRCYDGSLGAETIAFSFSRRGKSYRVSVVPTVLGPAEEGARIVADLQPASADADRPTVASIADDALPPLRASQRSDAASGEFDAAASLAAGIALNHRGLHVEASRILNDALSRLPPDAPAAMRAELLLEAGLADSNIRFFESAEQHFQAASAVLSGIGGDAGTFLTRKRDAYVALDLLNQRRFRAALAALDRLMTQPVAANEPLKDPAIVRVLNQRSARRAGVASAIAVPETAALAQLTLDAQANWARSVALLALGETAAAQTAIDRAQAAYAPLTGERIDQTMILWLGAQLDRQRGRLEARRKQYSQAIASFDRALIELRRSAVATAGTGTEPTIAETQLERAGIIADQGGDPVRVRAEYDAAVDALVAAHQSGGGTLPSGIERYFDLLVGEANTTPRPDTFERFFRAMQAVGEPAVARQLSQLQMVVTADPAVGVKVRDRAELERTITRLRYDIAAGTSVNAPAVADLEQQRRQAEAKLLQVEGELASSRRFRTIDDRPAAIDEIRRALKPGEAYLKLVQLSSRTYAIVVDADRTWIYQVAAPNAVLTRLAAEVRQSIDGKLMTDNVLVPFDVAGSYTLFRLITGPATDAVLGSRALVVDPAGPLQNIPAGVLVTDRASVDRYQASGKEAAFDFSNVSFLAARTTISTAVSPRSFLVVRSLPPSMAKEPFLGLGEHQPARSDIGDSAAKRTISVGFGCQVDFSALADLSRRLKPINKRELKIAATALGVPDAPEMTDAAFSDTAIEHRRDLADFEVLHFATHGLEEGVWGCAKSPPALVTSFGDTASDGLLSFAEIAGLRLDANLVVLSACDTATGVKDEALARRSGQEEAGSTLEGLVRAFLTANSRAVLATFWPVSADQETDRFMATFYGTARSKDIGGALQSAQEALIAVPAYSHPFYWGPYFLVGDSTKTMLTGAVRRTASLDPANLGGRAR